MELKIITKQEAIRLGLTEDNNPRGGDAGSGFMYEVVGKTKPAEDGGEPKDEILQVSRIDLKTNKKEILHEKAEWKTLKKKLKIKN